LTEKGQKKKTKEPMEFLQVNGGWLVDLGADELSF